ncbi:hypothetical protein P879_06240 [Paragonimus westermani]|uniref:Innexin n=1 Tax=Paragonimus westermani TaxID=34504 RepID=A0A8T0DJM5_9TREM|nr:hypothetical protein P879_06240 [Paragonimus westermani]
MFEAGILNGLTRISVEIGSSKSRSDDDFIDRLNHSYTTTVLMLCTVIVLGRQFMGKPISCWTPNEFTNAQVEYATLMCWVTSTYFVSPTQAQIPSDLRERRSESIHYYQWVPFMLMFQAAMFSVPCIIWRLFNWQSRIHLWTIMDLANKSGDVTESAQNRANHLHFVVRHLEDALVMRHRRKLHRAHRSSTSSYPTGPPSSSSLLDKDSVTGKGPRPCSPKSSSYLVGLYLIVKVLYIFNSTGQLFLVARQVFVSSWIKSYVARTTFEYQRVSFVRRLLIDRNAFSSDSNVFSQSSSSTSKDQSQGEGSSSTQSYGTIQYHLKESDKRTSAFFAEHVLGQDGIFVLRLVSINAGCQVASNIVERIWTRYKQASETQVPAKKSSIMGKKPENLAKMYIPPIPVRLERDASRVQAGLSNGQPGDQFSLSTEQNMEQTEGEGFHRKSRYAKHRSGGTQRAAFSNSNYSTATNTSTDTEIRILPYPDNLV